MVRVYSYVRTQGYCTYLVGRKSQERQTPKIRYPAILPQLLYYSCYPGTWSVCILLSGKKSYQSLGININKWSICIVQGEIWLLSWSSCCLHYRSLYIYELVPPTGGTYLLHTFAPSGFFRFVKRNLAGLFFITIPTNDLVVFFYFYFLRPWGAFYVLLGFFANFDPNWRSNKKNE